MATKKGAIQKVMESAADAAVELGEAARGLKESWSHVQKARSKGRPATRAVSRATKAVAKVAKRGAKTVAAKARR